MAWDDSLDPNGVHYAIAASEHRRIGVLAGPGTGKTRYGLMRRVARLLEQHKCSPQEILLLTFTRTAAHDLVTKLEDLGVPGANQVAASTVHGFCLGLLQREAILKITQRQPRMLLEHEVNYMLRDLGEGFGDMDERRERLWAFEAGWARATADHPGLAIDPADQSFEVRTIGWLRHHRAMLIGEVVPLAYRYLVNNPQAEERTRFRHVIVDEYQDLNTLEQRLIDLLVGPDASLCVSGDDDQSIYRFRWAHPEGVQIFVTDPNTERHDISVCGRCPAPILTMANSLIAHAPARNKPELICGQATPGSVAIVQWAELDAEVQGLVAAITSDIGQGIRQPGDFIVLVNRRRVGYRIRDALAAQEIDARSFFQDDALRSSSRAQASFAVLRLLANPDDRPSLRVWLGLEDADGRRDAYARLQERATTLAISEYETLTRIRQGSISFSGTALLRRFETLADKLESLHDATPTRVIEELFAPADPELADLRELALGLLPSVADVSSLEDELLRSITQPEVPQRPDYLRVMSLHKSKGLTSPVVVIATALDGIIPTIRAKLSEQEKDASYAEQRRLFYVAITRSSDELIISGPKRLSFADAKGLGANVGRPRYVQGVLVAECISTPYLDELGPTRPAAKRGEQWLAERVAPSRRRAHRAVARR